VWGVARIVGLLVLLGAALAPGAGATSFVPIATGLDQPVYVTAAPGDPTTLYVVEQPGRIQLVRNGAVAGTFLDIHTQVESDGEHGLLSVAFSPRYAQNHLFYVDYTDLNGNTHVDELSSSDATYKRELLVVQQPYPNHKGGQLEFDRTGFLYVGMGDGGTNPALGDTSTGDPENRAQNPASRLGKLLRIDPSKPGATWQVVGMGLRNPWRFSFDRTTGNLWIGDVGAGRYEEVDFRTTAKLGALANYGWSHLEGTALYNAKVALARSGTVVAPTFVYSHDTGGCGVIGGYVYRGARVPSMRGRYIYGDLCTGIVSSFKVGPKGRASIATRLTGLVSGLSSFGEDASGELYAVSLDGTLYQLR
jgi:glucose/arabinose dehydrogenase